jgi:hypothetical protein
MKIFVIPLFILSFSLQAQEASSESTNDSILPKSEFEHSILISTSAESNLNKDFLNNREPKNEQSPMDLSIFNFGIYKSVGVSLTELGVAVDAKVYFIETNVINDPIKLNVLGIGYSPSKDKGIILSPFNFRYNNIGLSMDVSIKSKMPFSGLTLNYSF